MVIGGVFGVLLLGLWLYMILDVILTDSSLCRNVPKPMWLLLVILLPAVGSIAWFIAGRPQTSKLGPGRQSLPSAPTRRPRPAPKGIEDRPDWPDQARKMLGNTTPQPGKDEIRAAADERTRKLREWESGLIKREKELDDERRKRSEDDS